MIPREPTAQCWSAPPVKRLYMPKKEPPKVSAFFSKYFTSSAPFNPGIVIQAMIRHRPRSNSVKMILDLSSGILKQLANVLAMARNMPQRWKRNDSVPGRFIFFGAGDFADTARGFDPGRAPVGQTDGAQGGFVHARSVCKMVQRFQTDWNIARRVARVVEAALR